MRVRDREAERAYSRRWRQRNLESVRRRERLYRTKNAAELRAKTRQRATGYTAEEYRAAFVSQGGRCKLCGETPRGPLHADHSHQSGEKRGLLCVRCNTGLGLFRDNPVLLARAVQYVEAAR